MKLHRCEYLDYMTGGPVERPLLCELFGPLAQLEPQWRAQGATADEISLERFGFDYLDVHRVGVNAGWAGGFEPIELERTDEHVITRDAMGRRVKLCFAAGTLPLPLEFPLKGPEDWPALREHYRFSEDRFVEGWAEAARAAVARGEFVVIGAPGAYAAPRDLMGDAELCMAYYDAPEMLDDMLDAFATLFERCCERLVDAGVRVDQLSVHEDLAGKSGPLAGPTQFERFFTPYYQRLWTAARAAGAQLFDVDSDGDIRPLVQCFVDAGVNVLHPLEPAAGVDMVEIHKTHGRSLGLKGGIDKMALRKDRAAIDAELEYRLQPCMRDGGVVFGLDHRIPDGVTIENYRYYVRRAREILGLGPATPGWARSAF